MKNKRLVHSAMIYTMLGIIPLASSLFLAPIYTHYLKPEEYGLIALASVLQTYLSLWVCVSLDGAFSRFYFNNFKDKAKTNEMLSNTLITILIITGITSVLLFFSGDYILSVFFGGTSFSYHKMGWQVLLTSGFGMCYSVIALYYRDSENVKMFSIIAILYFLLLTGCTFYGVVIASNGAQGSITGKMVGTIATIVPILIYIFIKCGFKFKMALTLDMLKYSFPLFIYGILAAVFDTMDRFFINHYFNLSVLGQYNFAFVIASVIGVVIASYQAAVNPPIYKMFLARSADNDCHLNQLLQRLIWTSLIFSSLCIILGYFVVHTFINEQYHSSISFIPLLAFSFIPRAYYMAWSYPLFIENKTKALPLINVVSIIAGIISNIILIPIIGVYGIALSVFIIKSAQAAGAYFIVKKLNIYPAEAYKFNSVNIASLVCIIMVLLIVIVPYTSHNYQFIIMVPFITVITLFAKSNYSLFKFRN